MRGFPKTNWGIHAIGNSWLAVVVASIERCKDVDEDPVLEFTACKCCCDRRRIEVRRFRATLSFTDAIF